MMTKLEQNLVEALIILFYEPEIKSVSDKYGDYGGLTIDRRMCVKVPDSEDPYDPMSCGYELFVTTINDLKYIGLYRTWIGDEYGAREGRIEVLISSYIGNSKYSAQRLVEIKRLTKAFDMLLVQDNDR